MDIMAEETRRAPIHLKEMLKDIDNGTERQNRHWESFTELYIKEIKKAKVIVDVGAEWGFYTCLAQKYGPPGCRIFTLEPDPVRFSVLENQFKNNENITLYPLAVSDKKGTLTLTKPGLGQSATADPLLTQNTGNQGSSFQVETNTMDALFPDTTIDVIKMDIEGAEVFAFQEMHLILAKRQTVIFLEMHPMYIENIKKDGNRFIEKMLEKYGYAVYDGNNRLTCLYTGRVVLRPVAGLPRIVRLTPEDALRKANTLYRIGRFNDSEKELRKLIKRKNNQPELLSKAYFLLGEISEQKGNPKTEYYFSQVLDRLLSKPGKTAMDTYRIASTYKRLKQYDLAVKWFNKVKALDQPGDLLPGVTYHLGELYYQKEEYRRSKEMFEACLQLNPKHLKAARFLEKMEQDHKP